MKSITLILFFVISIQLSAQNNSTTSYDIRDFYLVDYPIYNNKMSTWIRPDSLINHPNLSGFGEAMYNSLEYFQTHYSNLTYEYEKQLRSYLPDTARINKVFEKALVNDSALIDFLHHTINRSNRYKVDISTVQEIFARFCFFHRIPSGKRKGEITVHLCIGVNEVLKMPQEEHSPYLNAFCWTALRTNRELFETIPKEMIMPKQVEKDISDEEVIKIQQKNYDIISESKVIREFMISEYEKRKQYLNFEMNY